MTMIDEELIARLRGGINNMPLTTLGGVMHGEPCLAAADRIEALVGEVERLGKQCEGLMQAALGNGQALILAEAKVEKLVEALRRIREAWPTVRDAEGSGGTISAAIDEIDAALAEIEGGK